MKKILFVDSCIMGDESRTRRIAENFLKGVDRSRYKIETIVIDDEQLPLMGLDGHSARRVKLHMGDFGDEMFRFARQFASADIILIAAPFWDMSFPAKLKAYIECVSVVGITFAYDGAGNFIKCCKANRMIFITTRGYDIPDGSKLEQASPYLRAICSLYGIEKFEMISAIGLDCSSPLMVEEKIKNASLLAFDLAKSL